jgi:hypothetical protein
MKQAARRELYCLKEGAQAMTVSAGAAQSSFAGSTQH